MHVTSKETCLPGTVFRVPCEVAFNFPVWPGRKQVACVSAALPESLSPGALRSAQNVLAAAALKGPEEPTYKPCDEN